MKDFKYLLENFFTHKDYLAPADQIPGTMFTPLHFIFASIVLAVVIVLAILVSKKSEKAIKTIFTVIWALAVVLEVVKIAWESLSGTTVRIELGGVLPLYPCSVFMYAMPFAIFGKGKVRKAACGYLCTLGLIGGTINFVYPATILGNYSCISFSGFHTFFYHGAMLFTCLTMLISKYHSYNAEKWYELLLPSIPLVLVSIIANAVNYSPINSDYMFFKGNSFIFAQIFGNVSDAVTTIIFYVAYILIPALFYLPCFIKNIVNKKQTNKNLII